MKLLCPVVCGVYRTTGKPKSKPPPPQPNDAARLAAKLASGRVVSPRELQQAAAAARSPAEAWQLYQAVRVAGLTLETDTYAKLLSAVGRATGWDAEKRARVVYDDAVQAGHSLADPFLLCALISSVGRTSADAAFDALAAAGLEQPPDTACLNALLFSSLRSAQAARGLALLEQCSGRLEPDAQTRLAHVQLLAALGRLEEALAAYRACPPSARLLSAMLSAAGRGGEPELAWTLYAEARAAGVTPDAPVCVALIDACGSDADAAWRAWEEGRSASLDLASSEAAVCAMLCAFAKALQADRALLFFDSIRRAWPQRRPPAVAYALLRDAVAASGDPAAITVVAGLMAAELGGGGPRSERPVAPRRGPGAAVATFSVGGVELSTLNGDAEGALEEAAPARRLLSGAGAELITRLGEHYVPELSCVGGMAGGEAAQRAELACHAEKKALGALLVRAPDGSLPRVRVSIRLCRDCHAAFCAASSVFGLCIEAHDGHQHVFKDGACSCGGRWR